MWWFGRSIQTTEVLSSLQTLAKKTNSRYVNLQYIHLNIQRIIIIMIKFGRNNDFVKYDFFLSNARTVASWSGCQGERMCAFKPCMRLEKEANSEDSLMLQNQTDESV